MLGACGAIYWIIERHDVKTDKLSRIVNDPSDMVPRAPPTARHPRPAVPVVTVSLRTVEIVGAPNGLAFTEQGAVAP